MGSKGFDLVTHKRNSKGIVISKNPYKLHITGSCWEFERPPGSGNKYSPDGELIAGPLWESKQELVEKAKSEKEALEALVAKEAKVLEDAKAEAEAQKEAEKVASIEAAAIAKYKAEQEGVPSGGVNKKVQKN